MFLDLSFNIRILILLGLIAFTYWWTRRGVQNGLILGLVTGMIPMTESWLIRSEGGLPHLTLDRVVWPVVLLLFVLMRRRGETARRPLDAVEKNMLLLVGVIVLSMYVHKTYVSDQWGTEKVQLFPIVAGFFLPFISYSLARRGIYSAAHVTAFLRGVGWITVYLGVTGLGEAWQQHWLVYPKYILDPTVGIHNGYVRGPFISSSCNGVAMVMGVPVLLWLFFSTQGALRWVWLLGLACVSLSLPYVFQRAVWLGAAAALGVTILTWPKRGPLLFGGTVLAVALGLLFMPTSLERRIQVKLNAADNIAFRVELVATSMKIIRDAPLAGVGFTRFRKAIEEYSEGRPIGTASHNTIMTLMAELGLLGVVPYFAIFALFGCESAGAFWHRPDTRVIVGGLWGISAAYVIMLVSIELREIIYVNGLFFALWGTVLEGLRQTAPIAQPVYHVGRAAPSFV